MSLVLGVDGCRGGWLGLCLDTERRAIELLPVARWSELPWRAAAQVAVDMPIGLAESGPRACDRAARRRLPVGRKSSVFAPPRRYMLAAADWEAAHRLGRAREGVGLSKQAWNITARIRELDAALNPSDQSRVCEAHPELIFQHLNHGAPLPPKREAAGQRARLALLRRAPGLPDLNPCLRSLPRRFAGPDDVIDAAACALLALRRLAGQAQCLPAQPPVDSRGLQMAIWYCAG